MRREMDPMGDKVVRDIGKNKKEETEAFEKTLSSGQREGIDKSPDIPRQGRDDLEAHRAIARGTNEGLHKAYDRYLTPDQRNMNIAERTHFQDSDRFREGIQQKAPGLTENKLRSIHGYCDNSDGNIYVNREGSRKTIDSVVSHEGTHVFSNPEFQKKCGGRLNEGITEHLSRQANPRPELTDPEFRFDKQTGRLVGMKDVSPHYYDEEVKIAGMINSHARTAGEGSLEKAYFQGGKNIDTLSEAVDRSTGQRGVLNKVNTHMENAYTLREKEQFEEANQEYRKCADSLRTQRKDV